MEATQVLIHWIKDSHKYYVHKNEVLLAIKMEHMLKHKWDLKAKWQVKEVKYKEPPMIVFIEKIQKGHFVETESRLEVDRNLEGGWRWYWL